MYIYPQLRWRILIMIINNCRRHFQRVGQNLLSQSSCATTVYSYPELSFFLYCIFVSYLRSISFVCQITGWASRMTLRYCRFKSRPFNEHLLLPTITPSGFNIGINLKIKRFRNSYKRCNLKQLFKFSY